jgi:hypothetical protein
MTRPFNDLVDLIERAVGLARDSYDPGAGRTENGSIAWVVTQELRRAGYKIVSPTGYSYPIDLGPS